MTRKNDRRGVRGNVKELETFLYNIERQLKKKENKTDVWREKMRKHTHTHSFKEKRNIHCINCMIKRIVKMRLNEKLLK